MNIEDIKYCVEEFKPEGFEIHENLIGSYFLEYNNNPDLRYVTIDEKNYLFELFLVRVIEGINNSFYEDEMKFFIVQSYDLIMVNGESFLFETYYFNVDDTKVAAIKYVIDQVRG